MITTCIDHDFLEDDSRIVGLNGECMHTGSRQWQLDYRLYYATGYRGLIDAIDVLLRLIEILVEVDGNRAATIKRHLIGESALVEIVEG